MNHSFHIDNFLHTANKQFKYYKQLGESTIEQLSDDELFYEPVDGVNSISIIINHLAGNMRSRWTDFLNSDGEKSWRNRDNEFKDKYTSRTALINDWEAGWSVLFDALDLVSASNFNQVVYIRNQGHTIIEAISRQEMHYAYHIGQIVFIGKIIKGDKWLSLSIPKGNSAIFNAEKFKQEKSRGHFTDDFLKQ